MKYLASLFLLFAYSSAASAGPPRENIGELKIHDILLRPNFVLMEPQDGNFEIGESSFALRWELESNFHGVIRVGSRQLMNPSARYTATVLDDIVLVEAFAEYVSPYGRFRMGRIPTEFGVEGTMWERELVFPRAMLFSQRVVALRDTGASYFIDHNNFYTQVAVHNGESDDDVDGRMWYTAKWGYKFAKADFGFAGETGSTKPVSTSTSGDTLASVDVNRKALWRLGGLYWDYNPRAWRIILEAYSGEREQDQNIHRFATGHIDINRQWTKRFSTLLRYDHFDPDTKIDGNASRQASLALQLSNVTKSSNLILVGTKVLEEGTQIANDEIRLIWSLSPSGIVNFRHSH